MIEVLMIIYAILEKCREDEAKQPPKRKGYPSEEGQGVAFRKKLK
jgi:hypothetical protein